ncbi:hypothetical protein KM915_25050 [Cytobacillus oceanisediminis]|nr:hypothetical protein [Cytobacillus oceanisediminis]
MSWTFRTLMRFPRFDTNRGGIRPFTQVLHQFSSEFLRGRKVNIDADEEKIRKIIEMAY